MSVRKFKAGDLNQVATLFDEYRQFYEQSADIELASEFIRARIEQGESVILVAEGEEGKLQGFCQLYPSFCSILAKPIYILSDLYVKPAARNKGYARKLLDAGSSLGIADGMARLDLTTAKTNLKAQALYESQGWQRDEVYFAYSMDLCHQR